MDDAVSRHDDEHAILVALFRYGVIAPVAEQEDFVPGEVMRIVREIAETPHFLPGRGPIRVFERTVFGWLKAYREGGIEALRLRAGVELTPPSRQGLHSLRHTVATRLLEAGTPLETISAVMGHISPETTRIYTKVDIGALRSVALDPQEVAHA